jgi:hypothetical protein
MLTIPTVKKMEQICKYIGLCRFLWFEERF